MNITPPSTPAPSIAARAADSGVVMGGVIMVMVLATGFAYTYPLAGLLMVVVALAGIFVLYFLLRRSYVRTDYTSTMVELWAEGIAIFFLGSLVPAVVVYLLLRFVQPEFMAQQVDLALKNISQLPPTPEVENVTQALTTMRDKNLMPTAAQMAAQVIAMNMFVGMVLSLFEANVLIIRYRDPERRRRMSARLK